MNRPPTPAGRRARWLAIGVASGVLLTIGALGPLLFLAGVSARPEPSPLGSRVARFARHLAIPRAARARVNPVPASDEVIALGLAHWADHCAMCHANDGSGDTPIGKGLHPRAPDMRRAATQDLSDGELYEIIQGGVRLTGMPAWGEASRADDPSTWHLVHFIRHLPSLTAEELDEMSTLNPRTPAEIADEEETRRFLEEPDEGGGEDGSPASR